MGHYGREKRRFRLFAFGTFWLSLDHSDSQTATLPLTVFATNNFALASRRASPPLAKFHRLLLADVHDQPKR